MSVYLKALDISNRAATKTTALQHRKKATDCTTEL
jgi:hypothetical protein